MILHIKTINASQRKNGPVRVPSLPKQWRKASEPSKEPVFSYQNVTVIIVSTKDPKVFPETTPTTFLFLNPYSIV
ncbi:hypothetical protein ACFOVS_23560, partial [Rhizobium lemnae]